MSYWSAKFLGWSVRSRYNVYSFCSSSNSLSLSLSLSFSLFSLNVSLSLAPLSLSLSLLSQRHSLSLRSLSLSAALLSQSSWHVLWDLARTLRAQQQNCSCVREAKKLLTVGRGMCDRGGSGLCVLSSFLILSLPLSYFLLLSPPLSSALFFSLPLSSSLPRSPTFFLSPPLSSSLLPSPPPPFLYPPLSSPLLPQPCECWCFVGKYVALRNLRSPRFDGSTHQNDAAQSVYPHDIFDWSRQMSASNGRIHWIPDLHIEWTNALHFIAMLYVYRYIYRYT